MLLKKKTLIFISFIAIFNSCGENDTVSQTVSQYDCDGYGTIEYKGGSIYKGECKKDKRDGYGIMTYYWGDKYDGYWQDDKKNGDGTYFYADGSKYIGEWENDKKNGYGTKIWHYGENNETIYEGYWKDNNREGYGVITYYFGGKYDGYWKNNERDGNGTYYYKNGSVYSGEWRNDEPDGYGVIKYYWDDKYEGYWKSWNREGEGSYSTQYGTYTGIWKDNNLTEVTNQDTYEEAYIYFNEIRKQAGMIELERNGILEESAQSHSYYIQIHYNELEGLEFHSEIKGTEGFTGETAGDRAIYQGYLHKYVGEGISHRKTAKMSINSLMTAIYHRFGILAFSKDEFGVGFTQDKDIMIRNFVHNTGNSKLNSLCSYNSYSSGSYYSNICANGNWISVNDYDKAFNEIKEQNPRYILWPPKDSKDNLYRFEGETPNPIPDYNETGNPISIQFNDYYYPNKVEMKSFKLFKGDTEIKEKRVLTEKTDPNNRFSEYEFALFPLKVLEKDQEYRAEFIYIYNGEEKSIIWSFKTMKEL